jgi:Nucleotidyl transferase AbiEii toxin, Type IV TA system
MRYATADGFHTSLEARVNSLATGKGATIVRLRKMVVFDRLLARLLLTSPDRWMIKGRVALNLRLQDRARMTEDLDLAWRNKEHTAIDALLSAVEIDIGDYFVFSPRRSDMVDDAEERVAVRFRVRAELAGRRFEEMRVDIGFGDPFPSNIDILAGSDLLAFADLAPLAIPALPLERHLAEKVHAYSRFYESGRSSTRVKDLIDIVLIGSHATFQAAPCAKHWRPRFNREAPTICLKPFRSRPMVGAYRIASWQLSST